MQMCIQNTTAGVHCLTWPYKQHQHPWKSISGFCGCVCLACPYQDQYLLLFIHIPFCSHSCLLATQRALNQNEYHQHVKATQILDFNPNKVRALHQWLRIMIRFDMPGKQAKDGNDFIMWAPQTHHPLDVPTKMESIMHRTSWPSSLRSGSRTIQRNQLGMKVATINSTSLKVRWADQVMMTMMGQKTALRMCYVSQQTCIRGAGVYLLWGRYSWRDTASSKKSQGLEQGTRGLSHNQMSCGSQDWHCDCIEQEWRMRIQARWVFKYYGLSK